MCLENGKKCSVCGKGSSLCLGCRVGGGLVNPRK